MTKVGHNEPRQTAAPVFGLLVSLTLSAGACTPVSAPDVAASADSDDGIELGSSGEAGGGSSDSSSASSSAGNADDPKFDLGDGTPADPETSPEGCRKVDVVFAIDNSGSMQEEIDALAGPVFDSFPDQLLAINGGLLDFRLAVIDACNAPANFHNWGDSGDCGFGGSNFMVSSDPGLRDKYACVTELSAVGWDGLPDQCSGDNDDEQPANTAADAVSTVGPNDGFVRDDAVLLVVAITDEDEKPIPVQSPAAVAQKLIAAKGSIDNIVFLGIGGDSNCDGPYGSADEASTLRDVTNVFVDAGRGVWWDLCQGDLEQAFATVVSTVDTACSEFTPEG